MSRVTTKKLVGGAIIVALAIASFLLAPLWLRSIGEFLIVNDPLQRADVIVGLSGAVVWRAPKAVELFKAGYAGKILVTGGYANDYFLHLMGERMTEAEMVGRFVERLGVPPTAVVVLKGGTGTWEEAEYVRQYVRSERIRRIIVVTSHSHSRRVKWVFQKVLGAEKVKIMVVEADNGRYTAENWWRSEAGMVSVFTEYVKLFYYLINYSFREPALVKPVTEPVPAY